MPVSRSTIRLTIFAGILIVLGIVLLFARDRMDSVRKLERQRAFERVMAKEREVGEARALLARKLRELDVARAEAESLDARVHSVGDTARRDQ